MLSVVCKAWTGPQPSACSAALGEGSVVAVQGDDRIPVEGEVALEIKTEAEPHVCWRE